MVFFMGAEIESLEGKGPIQWAERFAPNERDIPREECGVFGIYIPPEIAADDPGLAVRLTFDGIFQNQHRGEEAAGVGVADGYSVSHIFKQKGLISKVHSHFVSEADPADFHGNIGLGHARYSTTGSSTRNNAGPFTATSELGVIAVSHNGNLTNAKDLVHRLEEKHVVYKSSTDSEILSNSIAHSEGATWEEKIAVALSACEGSFSLGIMTRDALYAARDTMGNRPLFWAEYDENGTSIYAISSETPAFLHLNGYKVKQIHEVMPGTIMKFDATGVQALEFKNADKEAFCGLETAYLLRADGRIRNNTQVDMVRRELGARLAQQYPPPVDIDAVTYVPESSRPAAEGYATELTIQWGRPIHCLTSMMKGRYPSLAGAVRGFMTPTDAGRKAVASNYYPMEWIRGKKILVVDDSIIRGNTTAGVIRMLREAGVKEIHLRIPWPPVKGPCPLGVDINVKDRLLWVESKEDLETMRIALGVDSLAFLSPAAYQETVDHTVGSHLGLCMGCATGDYPVTVFQADKTALE
jgi:amidophosphoribosyltransferase